MFEINQRDSRQIKGKTSKLQPLFVFIALVSLSTPALGNTVSLEWDPDPSTDVAGYKVYYSKDVLGTYVGTDAIEGVSPVDVSNRTSASLSGLDPSHNYYFTVTAYNSTGVESVYADALYVPENVSPTVAITSPVSGASVSGVLPIGVSASDNIGVTRLEMYVNGTLLASDTAAPYAFSWDTSSVAAGTYTLSARAFDAAGNMGQSDVTVSVGSDTVPPSVTLASPINGSTLNGTVAITANATDNFGVTKIELYENGVLLGASNISPFNYSWNTTNATDGSYTLFAKAYDASGNVGQSSSVSVTVKNADTTPPVVTSFSMPASSLSLTVPVSGFAATDNVGVTGYLISESAAAPSVSSTGWSPVPPASFTFAGAGTRTAYAWAKDAAGNVSAAASASVSVGDVNPPAITAFSMPTTYNSLTVPVSSFTATDDVGVTGYLITESSSKPSATASGWSSAAPSSFTFSAAGTRTAYAWTKDAAGNVSASCADTVVVDASAPVVTSLSPANGTVLSSSSVTIKATATDNIKVTAVQVYLDNTLKLQTSAATFSWSTSIPTKGTHVIMVKALDAAGNVGSRSVTIYR